MKSIICVICALFSFIVPLSALVFIVPSGTTRIIPLDIPDDGDSGIIEEGAAVDVAGANIDAVTMSGANQAVLNQGRVSTTGDGAVGIYNGSNANAVITNTGLISTIGDVSGADAASGIFNDGGANAVITNRGRISTTGGGTGIETGGDNVMIRNSGLISTSGDSGIGITGSGNDGVFLNSGRIVTTGPDGIGIAINDMISNNVVTNSGLISTRGGGADGILNGGDNTVIINSGIISTRGGGADGIFNGNLADDLHIINSGTIRAAQAFALDLDGSNLLLTLLRGSNLQGPVQVIADPLNLNVETGLNLALTLNSGNFGAFGIEAPFIHLGQTVAVLDPTGLAMQADIVADLSDAILNGIYRHKTAFPCSCPCLPFDCGMWFQGIGSTRKRSKDTDYVGYDNWQGGFLIGRDTRCGESNVNFFGGISSGEATVDQETQKADTTSYVVGLTYERLCGNTFLGLAFAAAYVDWDNDRFVMNNLGLAGVDTATADTGGAFISPEVTLARRFASIWYYPTLSFTLRYAGLFLGDYQEEGSLTNLTVRNRAINLLTTRFEIAIPYTDTWGLCCWSIEPYVGVFGRYQLSDNRVHAELLGQSLCFNPGNPRNLASLLAGFRGIQSFDDFHLFLNLEASFDNYESTRILGEGGIGFSF